jgi:hypothetical protein
MFVLCARFLTVLGGIGKNATTPSSWTQYTFMVLNMFLKRNQCNDYLSTFHTAILIPLLAYLIYLAVF